MGSQSLTGHQTVNMKVVLALACVVAGASAYPMFFLEEADPVEYYPVHRVARQNQDHLTPTGELDHQQWRTLFQQLILHMVMLLWDALRSKCTGDQARETMTLHHGATTTPSQLTLLSIIRVP